MTSPRHVIFCDIFKESITIGENVRRKVIGHNMSSSTSSPAELFFFHTKTKPKISFRVSVKPASIYSIFFLRWKSGHGTAAVTVSNTELPSVGVHEN